MMYRLTILLSTLLLYTLSSHSINAHSFQGKDAALQNQNDLIVSLQQKLKTPHYSKEVLPNDFSDLSQLLAFGTTSNQSAAYPDFLMNLFSKILKRSQYVNASAFSQLLENLPNQLLPYFSLPASRMYITNPALYDATFVDRFKVTVNNALYAQFSTDYDSFRQDPAAFLHNISGNIVVLAQEEMAQAKLRHSIIRFCEIGLNKLVWDPTTHERTWFAAKRIAEQLAQLLEHNILDDTNDLEDLHLTLLNRYCYFIELTATDMPESFYASIRNDLRADNNIVLFALAEQDDILESKLAYMQRTLIEAETAAYRFKAGLPRL